MTERTNAFAEVQRLLNQLERATNLGHEHEVQAARIQILRIINILTN